MKQAQNEKKTRYEKIATFRRVMTLDDFSRLYGALKIRLSRAVGSQRSFLNIKRKRKRSCFKCFGLSRLLWMPEINGSIMDAENHRSFNKCLKITGALIKAWDQRGVNNCLKLTDRSLTLII